MKIRFNIILLAVILVFTFCSCGKSDTVSSDSVNFKVFEIGDCVLNIPENWKSEISQSGSVGTVYIEQDDGFKDNIFISVNDYDHLLIYYTEEQLEESFKKVYNDMEITGFDTSSELNGTYTIIIEGHYTKDGVRISFKQFNFNYGEHLYCVTLSSNEDTVPDSLSNAVSGLKFK